jgi:hypothetical protein
MALKLSTGLVNKLMGMQAEVKAFISGTTLAYSDNGGSADTITDSGSGFITAGFAPGDLIYTYNPTTGGNKLSGVTLTAVTAGTLTFATGTLAASEAFPAAGCIVACKGGSLRDIFKDGVLRFFSGTAPATADAAITGTLLCQFTLSSGAFVAGAFDNGLELGDATAGVVNKASGEVWSGVALADGSATHYRLVGNASDSNGSSTSLPRIQGTIAQSGGDINMPSGTTMTTGETTTIDSFSYTMSPS